MSHSQNLARTLQYRKREELGDLACSDRGKWQWRYFRPTIKTQSSQARHTKDCTAIIGRNSAFFLPSRNGLSIGKPMSLNQQNSTKTTCPYCGVGCGVEATHTSNRIIAVSGDQQHPSNAGKLCVKGSALAETTSDKGRLLHPIVNGERTSWDDAINYVAKGFQQTIEKYGPDSVAFYLSGQLLTEDYYLANKLVKGFLGTANIDTNSRLCMSSAVVAHKRAFGCDAVPGNYEDLEHADLLLLVGSNAAWAHPIVYQRIAAAKQQRPEMKIVVIDPRKTATCDIADLHLPIRPGADAFLFNGLLAYLASSNQLDHDYLANHTNGFAAALESAKHSTPDLISTAQQTALNEKDLLWLFEQFGRTEKVVTVFSQGINQSSSGSDKGNAIINCHLATGKIGKPGAAPFSITGQPNAMGGREVGGLANQLASHMDFSSAENIDKVARFWQTDKIARKEGLKAVDMMNAVADGRIKAVWIIATNPAVSMPEADKVKEALKDCDLVVVSDCNANTDTTSVADVLLPATGWGEKDGTVTNAERRISRQRALTKPTGEALHDWQILQRFAHAMGYKSQFNYQTPADIFREHAALSGFENTDRLFDISQLSQISDLEYDRLAPVCWPVTQEAPKGTKRLFSDGKYYTSDNKARFLAITPSLPSIAAKESEMILNTGRTRDQWHTMTRTGKSSRLLEHNAEPYIEIHPLDAESLQLKSGGLAELSNPNGQFIGRVKVTEQQNQGSVFAPIHWTSEFSSQGRIDTLVNAIADPYSGQPESKHSPVSVARFPAKWYGTLLTRNPVSAPASRYWSRVPNADCELWYLAHDKQPGRWKNWLSKTLDCELELVEFTDESSGSYRVAAFKGEQLEWIFLMQKTPNLPDSQWLVEQFAPSVTHNNRAAVLAAIPAGEVKTAGKTICSCFGVGINLIHDAIDTGCHSVKELGANLKCGTNCGSCIPELKNLLTTAGY